MTSKVLTKADEAILDSFEREYKSRRKVIIETREKAQELLNEMDDLSVAYGKRLMDTPCRYLDTAVRSLKDELENENRDLARKIEKYFNQVYFAKKEYRRELHEQGDSEDRYSEFKGAYRELMAQEIANDIIEQCGGSFEGVGIKNVVRDFRMNYMILRDNDITIKGNTINFISCGLGIINCYVGGFNDHAKDALVNALNLFFYNEISGPDRYFSGSGDYGILYGNENVFIRCFKNKKVSLRFRSGDIARGFLKAMEKEECVTMA